MRLYRVEARVEVTKGDRHLLFFAEVYEVRWKHDGGWVRRGLPADRQKKCAREDSNLHGVTH